mgnify:CR=1 FL=1
MAKDDSEFDFQKALKALKSGKPAVIDAIIEGTNDVMAEPFRRDAMKKPEHVAGIDAAGSGANCRLHPGEPAYTAASGRAPSSTSLSLTARDAPSAAFARSSVARDASRSASRRRIRCVSAGCDTPSVCAAAVKLPASATARNWSR